MTLLDKTNTLVIVPAYNEQDSIVSVIEEIKATGFPFVVIDDGSTDETRNRAISAGARTISLPFNTGVGGSLKCGFQYAVSSGYEAIIQCDADGQHPTEHFGGLLLQANLNLAHLVIGSRFIEESTTMDVNNARRIGMKLLSSATKRRCQVDIDDTTSGFRLIAQPLLGQFAKNYAGYYLGDTFEALNVAASNGYSVSQVNVPFSNRTHGRSSASSTYAASSMLKILFIHVMGLQFRIDSNLVASA